jgi:ribonuclease T1
MFRLILCAILLAASLAGPVAFALQGDVAGSAKRQADFAAVLAQDLPKEAHDTLLLIRKAGPYPYTKDGSVFVNREHSLPAHVRGYYREFTVKTPGRKNRGARRIIAGTPGEYYYTDDHYRSFKRIKEKP